MHVALALLASIALTSTAAAQTQNCVSHFWVTCGYRSAPATAKIALPTLKASFQHVCDGVTRGYSISNTVNYAEMMLSVPLDANVPGGPKSNPAYLTIAKDSQSKDVLSTLTVPATAAPAPISVAGSSWTGKWDVQSIVSVTHKTPCTPVLHLLVYPNMAACTTGTASIVPKQLPATQLAKLSDKFTLGDSNVAPLIGYLMNTTSTPPTVNLFVGVTSNHWPWTSSTTSSTTCYGAKSDKYSFIARGMKLVTSTAGAFDRQMIAVAKIEKVDVTTGVIMPV